MASGRFGARRQPSAATAAACASCATLPYQTCSFGDVKDH